VGPEVQSDTDEFLLLEMKNASIKTVQLLQRCQVRGVPSLRAEPPPLQRPSKPMAARLLSSLGSFSECMVSQIFVTGLGTSMTQRLRRIRMKCQRDVPVVCFFRTPWTAS